MEITFRKHKLTFDPNQITFKELHDGFSFFDGTIYYDIVDSEVGPRVVIWGVKEMAGYCKDMPYCDGTMRMLPNCVLVEDMQ